MEMSHLNANHSTHLRAGVIDKALWLLAASGFVALGSQCIQLFLID
jgi:hypothetical protein